MQIIINAGGTGSRLWPLSTNQRPKQFVNLIDNENFVQKTIQRLHKNFKNEQIWLSTNKNFEKLAINSLPKKFPANHLLLEPEKRDTFASILAQTAVVAHFTSKEETLIFVASDHLINQKDWQAFNKGLSQMSRILKNSDFELVIAGIKPTFANTELGYIELGKQIGKEVINKELANSNQNGEARHKLAKLNKDSDFQLEKSESEKLKSYKVLKFREKPDFQVATEFVQSGNFLWNLGYFAINYAILLKIIKKHWPNLVPILEEIYQTGQINPEIYAQIPKNSIDFALVEKLDKIAAVKMEIDWQDIGNWNILSEFLSEIPTLENGKLTQIKAEKDLEKDLETSLTENLKNESKLKNNSQNSMENNKQEVDQQIGQEGGEKIKINQKNLVKNPKHLQIKSQNNKIKSQNDKNIVIIGVSDLIVVESNSGILIMNKNQAKMVKEAANYFENL